MYGVFTVENKGSGEFRTFEIREMPEDSKFAPGQTVLSLLTGPSNSHDYRGFAFIGNGVKVWKKCRSEDGDPPSDYEYFAQMFERLVLSEDSSWLEKYEIHEAIPCRRCGEQLTVPKSIRAGVGPVCAQKE